VTVAYATAIGLPALFLAARPFSLSLLHLDLPPILFLFPVILSAFLGGLGPGLLASVLTVPGVAYWVLPPEGSLAVSSSTDLVRLVSLAALSVLTSALSEAMHRQRRRAIRRERHVRLLFERSPVPLLEEDLSEARRLVEAAQRRAGGDLRSYLAEHPEEALRIVEATKILNVNEEGLKLLDLDPQSGIVAGIAQHLDARSFDALSEILVQLTAGATTLQCEIPAIGLGGTDRTFALRLSMAPEDAQTWSRVLLSLTDITERARFEDELRRSEAHLQLVIDAVPALIAYIDLDRRYRWGNETFRDWLGVDPRAAGGLDVRSALGEESWQIVEPYLGRAFHGERVSFEQQLTYPAGGRRWVNVTYTPDLDDDGKVRGVVVLTLDIGQAKRIEAELREKEERHRLALDAAALGTWQHDIAQGVVHLDARAQLHYGFDRPEVRIEEILARIHPEDLETFTRAVALAASSTGRGRYHAQYRLMHPEGSIRWLAAHAQVQLIGEGGAQHPRATGTSLDITESKRTEEQMRLQAAALESAANGIVIVDRSGTIQWVNAAFTRLTGYLPSEAIGQNPRILRSGMQDRGFYEKLWTTILAGQVWHGEVVNRRKDGSLYTEEMTITPVRSGNGEISHFIAIKQDVSQRIRAEQERQQLEARLGMSQKLEALGTLAGGVAHDFNNILGAIMGNAELAAQDVAPQHPVQQSLIEIRKASQRAKELVQRILAFSRQQPAEQKVIALCPVIKESVDLLRASIPAGTVIEVRCDDETPDVLADATQVEQAIVNLCTNAWQAMPGGVGRIEISIDAAVPDQATSAQGALRDKPWARITVKDNGCGMDKETVDRIYEPFFTTKPPGQGTGLGLSVVHGIVQGHGGVIDVASQPGAGTTFTIYLPPAGAPSSRITALPQHPGEHATGHGEHVLYLDDEEPLVLLVTRALERLGYRVSGFTEPQAALAALKADPTDFDVVVTDLNMPGGSGLHVAREIAQLRPDLPVILASGYITDELREEAPRAGVKQLIYKPNTVDELCAAVQLAVSGCPDGIPDGADSSDR
jgi:PAS domain S-box-containing protein